MKKILFSLALLTSMSADILRVATAPNYPPYEYLENNELKGFDVDIIKEIAKRNNLEVEFKYMDFDGLIPSLKSNKVDLIGAIMKKTPARAKAVEFTINFKDSSNYFIKRIENNENQEIKNCKDLDFTNTLFGAELGSVQYDIAKKSSQKEVKGFANSSISILSLQSKKIDAIVLDKVAAVNFLNKNPDLQVVCEYKDEDSQGFAVNKGNTKLLEIINKSLQEMLDDGTINKISKKYKIN
ncbi:amino acid ABC transporter substrate-binding protein [Campylobacter sp. RM12640]|uniref:substrate-binding periplasmic protein n=1 Tax=unclassified Campylobacter TaxID=2593542 RepID=UPI003014CE0C|nr:amino acid ABC transporter substrate-binding protein [Campylobacter sp. RM12640]MBZ7989207.1 amino acid ABC transporter substrate-binding protein [Campylobacter sp. RM12635]